MSIFKLEDKVFDFKYGWGFIFDSRCPIIVRFSEYTVSYAKKDLKTLSFTEYTLQGFSQERPVELPEVGELCVVRDEEGDEWELCYFISYKSDAVRYKFETSFGCYNQMKRIKILD